jgi:SulP family sulfate permease
MPTKKKPTPSLFLQGILPLEKSQISTDILAGVTLAALAIPEVMGYTRIAGTPVITGLYTILIPMALYAFFGSSRHMVVGADSATAAILAATLSGMAVRGSAQWVALSGVLAVLSAVFLLLARLVRLGFLADFLSRTVLVGFLTGVGVQVALGQVPGMLGLAGDGSTLNTLRLLIREVGMTNGYTLSVAAAVLVVITGLKRVSRRVPAALIAVVGAIVAGKALHLDAMGVHLLGPIPKGMPGLGLPDVPWSWGLINQLIPTAFAMFVVILSQSAATARAYAAHYNERFDENTDLVGLGMANIGAALSGTFVVNGSPTKTQMVESAGGCSQLAQVTTCGVVLLVLLFLTGPLAYLPDAALSAVVFLIGLELVDISGMKRILAERPSEFWVALVTALVVVFVGVEQSILLAVVLSLLEHTRQGYRPNNAVLVADGGQGWRSLPVTSPQQAAPGLMIYRFTHSIYYANTELLLEQVVTLAKEARPPLGWFCISAAAIDDIDFTAAAALRTIHRTLKDMGIRLVFAEVSGDVRNKLDRYRLTTLLGNDAFYETVGGVVEAFGRQAAGMETKGRGKSGGGPQGRHDPSFR